MKYNMYVLKSVVWSPNSEFWSPNFENWMTLGAFRTYKLVQKLCN